MKQETQDAATLIWEWEHAPESVRAMSPAYDDVSYVVILPRGETAVPYWIESLGCGDEWKRVIKTGEMAGRVIVSICHA